MFKGVKFYNKIEKKGYIVLVVWEEVNMGGKEEINDSVWIV